MKNLNFRRFAFGVLLAVSASVSAQNFSIESLIGAGAGQSAGGGYSLEGQVASFYPGRVIGGTYVLESDILGAAVTPVPGEVELLASYTNGQLTILWDRAAAGFQLEATDSLGALPWAAVNLSPQANATHFYISIPVPAQHQFFRLRRP